MTIIIDIKPEVEAEPSRQAAAHGVDMAAYAASLLEAIAHAGPDSKKLNQGRLELTLQEMSQFSYKIPSLPDEALTRESLYQ